MNEKKKSTLLKVALAIFAIVVTVYGISLLFFTNGFIEMSGTDPIEPNWIRWPGGVLIALAYGALRVIRNPINQDNLVKVIAFGTLFTGLALLYEIIFEMQPQYVVWFTALPCIVNLGMSALIWLGRYQAREILRK